MNNYLIILSFLKQFEGDEEYHNIENILPDNSNQVKIFKYLRDEGLIRICGGPAPVFSFGKISRNGYRERNTQWTDMKAGEDSVYKGKITFKGSQYLKEELKTINDKNYNIQIGNNTTANIILDSANAAITNRVENEIRIDEIIKILTTDSSLTFDSQTEAIKIFITLKNEIGQGRVSKPTSERVIALGASIASIGSLVLSLIQHITNSY